MSTTAVVERVRRLPRLGTTLDWAERGVMLGLYAWLVMRIITAYLAKGSLADLLLLPSEGLVVFFLLIRRPATQISPRPMDWILAFAATISPLLANPTLASPLAPGAVSVGLILMGILVQVSAKLVLARSFGFVAANRGLKFSGPYRHVRHPMYFGYLLSHVGFLLANPTAWNLAVYGLCYALQVPRLLAEERLLREDPQYAEYMATVRYRLVPGVF